MKKNKNTNITKDQKDITTICPQCGGQMEITTIGNMHDKIQQCSYCNHVIDIKDSFFTKKMTDIDPFTDANGNTVKQTTTTLEYRTDDTLDLDQLGFKESDFLKHAFEHLNNTGSSSEYSQSIHSSEGIISSRKTSTTNPSTENPHNVNNSFIYTPSKLSKTTSDDVIKMLQESVKNFDDQSVNKNISFIILPDGTPRMVDSKDIKNGILINEVTLDTDTDDNSFIYSSPELSKTASDDIIKMSQESVKNFDDQIVNKNINFIILPDGTPQIVDSKEVTDGIFINEVTLDTNIKKKNRNNIIGSMFLLFIIFILIGVIFVLMG